MEKKEDTFGSTGGTGYYRGEAGEGETKGAATKWT